MDSSQALPHCQEEQQEATLLETKERFMHVPRMMKSVMNVAAKAASPPISNVLHPPLARRTDRKAQAPSQAYQSPVHGLFR
jgi:hypothetical protein